MEDRKEDVGNKERPTPKKIYDLVHGFEKAYILKTAIQLDVFSIIANGLRTVEAIVAAKNWKVRPTHVLLDSLCPLGFLTKKGGRYLLTPVSEAFLVSSSESYVGRGVLADLASDVWEQLAKAVKTGQRQTPDAGAPEHAAYWEEDAAAESVRTSRTAKSLEMWRTVGIDPNAKQEIRVLDLASGCGINTFVLGRRNPNAKIACIDWPVVLQTAEKLADKWGIREQVNFRAGDLMTMDLGDSKFDAVLLSWVTYFWGPDENEFILRNVYRGLARGGRVVIQADMADEERCSSESLIDAVSIFLFTKKGKIYTFSEYRAMLEEAGFSQITKHSESLVSARK